MERRDIRAEEREALAEFARLKITLTELYRCLNGMIDLEFGPTERRFTSYYLLVNPGIEVVKADVDRALAMRQDGSLSESDLVRWATMLSVNDAYVSDEDDEEISNALWDLSFGGMQQYYANREF
jgi:hypothetical protein